MKKRDRQLGESLRKLEVPEHSPDFFDRLAVELDRADAEAGQEDLGSSSARERQPSVASRRRRAAGGRRGWGSWLPSLPSFGSGSAGPVITARPLAGGMVAVALAAAILLAVMVAPPLLTDEMSPLSPGIASAAEIKAKMSAALESVSALRGVLVVVSGDAQQGEGGEMRWTFATTDRGDFRLRGENTMGDGSVLREELAYDARAGVEMSWWQQGDDPVMGGSRSGLAAGPPDAAPSEWVLERRLGAVVRALLADEDPAVSETTYEGRPAWVLEAAVPVNLIADSSPDRLQITVDQQTGFPVRVVETLEGRFIEELRLEQLELDPVLEEGHFRPDPPAGLELTTDDQGFRRVEPAEVEEVVGYAPLLPTWLPEGYELALVTAAQEAMPTGKEGMNPVSQGVVSLSYRRGFDHLTISTRLVGPDGAAWSAPLSAGEGFIDSPETISLGGGAFAGRQAEVAIDPLVTPHLWSLGERLVLVVAGDASRDELIRVAESVAPASD
jgi:hypothetical protein